MESIHTPVAWHEKQSLFGIRCSSNQNTKAQLTASKLRSLESLQCGHFMLWS
jgi:hypothetical protein